MLGVPQRGTLRTGTIDSWLFEGMTDQDVEVVFNGFGLHVELIAPDGTILGSGDDNLSETVTLPMNGQYTVMVQGGSISTGLYTLQVR